MCSNSGYSSLVADIAVRHWLKRALREYYVGDAQFAWPVADDTLLMHATEAESIPTNDAAKKTK
jgi:hypothetical protein